MLAPRSATRYGRCVRILVGLHSTYPWRDGEHVAARQRELGLDWITIRPAQQRDPITGVASHLSGTCLGQLVNTPFRATPCREIRIQARLRRGVLALDEALAEARSESDAPIKVSITGPYTLARLSRLETTAYRDWRHLAEDLANHLADALAVAGSAGARWVQVDEPFILQSPMDIRFLRDLLEPIQDAVQPNASLIVSTYGAVVGDLFAHLNSLPGTVVGLDCASSPDVIADLATTGSGKPLALGAIGAGVTPSIDDTARAVSTAMRRYEHETLYLQPSCGLDALAEETAHAKVAALLRVRDAVADV